MKYIAHRINKVEDLKKLPREFGVEIDLRDSASGKIHISHDPFIMGEDFDEYLSHYQHGTMILNIKSERIEPKVLELLKKHNISDYFFLDSSFPMIYLLSQQGEKNIALRFSEFEGMDTLINMKDRVKWVWVDCFSKLPIDFKIFMRLKELNYNLCLVSPELQGREADLVSYKKYLEENKIRFDAICTKSYNIKTWEN